MTNRLAEKITAAGYTQADVADALGVTQTTVSRKISGKSAWKVSELAQLAMLLGMTPAQVLALVSEDGAA